MEERGRSEHRPMQTDAEWRPQQLAESLTFPAIQAVCCTTPPECESEAPEQRKVPSPWEQRPAKVNVAQVRCWTATHSDGQLWIRPHVSAERTDVAARVQRPPSRPAGSAMLA